MSQFIEEFCNDLANYNDNFLTPINPKSMTQKKVKWQLVEMVRYDGIMYMLKKDGESIKAFCNYEQAVEQFNLAVNFIDTDTVIREVEI
jgi:hypothetical protein